MRYDSLEFKKCGNNVGTIIFLPIFTKHSKTLEYMAGINGMELVKETKGGRTTETLTPRYALISSHTARRTGATLMYLAGVDVYDIMTATGHKTISNLEKYIKVKADARALMMAKKYSYFSE